MSARMPSVVTLSEVVLLHFQAVDYDATVWVDGTEVGRHRGGFTPFSIELEARHSGFQADSPRGGGKAPSSFS